MLHDVWKNNVKYQDSYLDFIILEVTLATDARLIILYDYCESYLLIYIYSIT